jgi:hypothetical protein
MLPEFYLKVINMVIALLVEALCHKADGRGFVSLWGHWIFQFI